MPAEGTGDHKPYFFSTMIATYRGVKYDTAAYKAQTSTLCSTKVVTETYRGIKHDEKVKVCK